MYLPAAARKEKEGKYNGQDRARRQGGLSNAKGWREWGWRDGHAANVTKGKKAE